MWLVIAVLGFVAVLVVARWHLVHRVQSPLDPEPFEGQVYRIGDATVLERAGRDPSATVVCMHGYLENFHYFTEF